MDKQGLVGLILGGEDSFTEFNRETSQHTDIAGEMIAFANTEGGQILVGVDDIGSIFGVSNPQQTEE